jgi:hypothetical protein
MNPEEQAYVRELEAAYKEEQNKARELSMNNATSVFAGGEEGNLIEWQLELDNILERIEHLLRGDRIEFDESGQMHWKKPESPEDEVFNEYGVQEILRILSMYLNRNTILSNYDEDTINNKVYDFSLELIDLILVNHVRMGMNTDHKKRLFPMIVREIVDTVHSSYLRALNGGERESLRKVMSVTQTAFPAGGGLPQPPPSKKFNILKPTTWSR